MTARQTSLRLPQGKTHKQLEFEAKRYRRHERQLLANLYMAEVVDWPDDPHPYDQLKDDAHDYQG